jgi:hypothetical protein
VSLRSTERLGRLAGREVDRLQRLHQRRQRFHRRPDDDLLAVRDARLDPAGAVRLAVEALLVAVDLVVRLEPRIPASAKPSPISTPFTAWMPISAAASRASRRVSRTRTSRGLERLRGADLDDPADGVALGACSVDARLQVVARPRAVDR